MRDMPETQAQSQGEAERRDSERLGANRGRPTGPQGEQGESALGGAMTPYYQDDFCTIYHGDCREILPTLPKVDLVLTDPPYGMGFRSNRRVLRHDMIAGESVEHALNAAYVFCRWDNLGEMPPPRSVLAWVKNNWSMGDLEHEHGRQWEAICFYPRDGHMFTSRIPDVIYASRTGNALHPTEKPVRVIEVIIKANVAKTILDPFMGSGTTLVAAKRLGRKAIGIEIEKKYCDIAIERLRQNPLPFEAPDGDDCVQRGRERAAQQAIFEGGA